MSNVPHYSDYVERAEVDYLAYCARLVTVSPCNYATGALKKLLNAP